MGAENPQKLATLPELADVNSDQQDNGAEMNLVYDRDAWHGWESTYKPPTAC